MLWNNKQNKCFIEPLKCEICGKNIKCDEIKYVIEKQTGIICSVHKTCNSNDKFENYENP